jgi:hypothetical protein
VVRKLPREISDHNPLIISTRVPRDRINIQFKFDLNWLSSPDFFMLVEKIWRETITLNTSIDVQMVERGRIPLYL